MAKRLRSGYTTGACAAAAAKAAGHLWLTGNPPKSVEIPFPDGSRHRFHVHRAGQEENGAAFASIIKDAGDDPDVTNGAEITATITTQETRTGEKNCAEVMDTNILICGGSGVGRVTKPGLAVAVGEPAINPVPRQMIVAAVQEVFNDESDVQVIISVTNGEELSQKTLNRRLGIIGGLSILGTTGIVRPVSAEAWKATIQSSLDVAWESGLREIVLSTGRTSERGAQTLLDLPEEAYAMMGDYLEFSLVQSAERGFAKIHLAGMWAKIMKAALEVGQTHVRNGALEMKDAAALLKKLGASEDLYTRLGRANTAREMYEILKQEKQDDLVLAVLKKAKKFAEKISGVEVTVSLVTAKAKVVERV